MLQLIPAFYEKHQKELPIASTCKKNTFGVVMLHQAGRSHIKL